MRVRFLKLFALMILVFILALILASSAWAAKINPEDYDELEVDPLKSVMILFKSPHTIDLYTTDGKNDKLLERVQGYLPLYWIDDYRCVFTYCVPDKKRGTAPDALPWRGVAVLEIFSGMNNKAEEILITPVAEPTATEDYIAVSTDDENCVVERWSVPEAKDWDNPGVDVLHERFEVPLPAAG